MNGAAGVEAVNGCLLALSSQQVEGLVLIRNKDP